MVCAPNFFCFYGQFYVSFMTYVEQMLLIEGQLIVMPKFTWLIYLVDGLAYFVIEQHTS